MVVATMTGGLAVCLGRPGPRFFATMRSIISQSSSYQNARRWSIRATKRDGRTRLRRRQTQGKPMQTDTGMIVGGIFLAIVGIFSVVEQRRAVKRLQRGLAKRGGEP